MGATEADPLARTVVVVEDDVDVRETLAEVLEEEGYPTLPFADGPAALEALEAMAQLPALILLDLMMPKMDGWAFRAAQRRSPRLCRVPTVILSADSNVHENLAALGAHGYLRKPIHIKNLLTLVARFCGPASQA